MTYILNKLILIFLSFIWLLLLFFLFSFFAFHYFIKYFLGNQTNSHLQTQKILTHTLRKNFKPQHYLIKPVLLPFQNFLKPSSPSLPKLSQISFELHGRPPSLITAATTTIGVGSFFSFFDQPSLYLSIRSNSYPNGSNSNSNG